MNNPKDIVREILFPLIPGPAYRLTIRRSGEGYDSDISLPHLLPLMRFGKTMRHEVFEGDCEEYQIRHADDNRLVAVSLPLSLVSFLCQGLIAACLSQGLSGRDASPS